MIDARRRGAGVEAAARAHLLRAGLVEVAANAGYRLGELDLVMRDGDTLVFVEVRYRASAEYGGGAESVDRGKRRRIVRAAQLFLLQHPTLAEDYCRFDVIDASGDPDAPAFTWHRDAFSLDQA
ncbi:MULTISPECIES: YraN family protein [unclassified Luteimonas]|uniref:YraN family protein n=1 Tax=unclassified Luteimonas TaxID=2629088 RepID=UPI0018F07540|nr:MULTISPECIES: YraN family protein [unclassified Luteimonas]MBJ6980256.1 YraN family protein [Luteimonas sp. MC1895]MBJ6985266.1 YraN family protein [Luteimonas sp. MC1750]QQO05468.1 YraN family protein [Luteimonas sp. MC1750]